MLYCHCPDIDHSWWYFMPEDYSTLKTSKRKRCVSCKELINIGALCTKFECWRYPHSDIEEKIYDTEVPLAYKYMCEECSDIYFNLEELGFCVQLGDSMQELLQEYRDYYANTNNDRTQIQASR